VQPRREAAIELFLDRTNAWHLVAAAVLAVSGVACAWIGVRDGFLRRRVRTNSGLLTGRGAAVAGALYVATGVAGVAGAILFLLRGP
jgi:hypothetical protein